MFLTEFNMANNTNIKLSPLTILTDCEPDDIVALLVDADFLQNPNRPVLIVVDPCGRTDGYTNTNYGTTR